MPLISKFQIHLPYGQSINGHFCIFHVACKKNQNCVVPDLKTVKGNTVSAISQFFFQFFLQQNTVSAISAFFFLVFSAT